MPRQQAVLVTGGASGIGFAIVQAILAEGGRAIVADLAQANLEQARETLKASSEQARFEQLDVSDEAAVVRTVARCEADFAPVAGLVNSAGIASDTPALETTAGLFRRMLDVNLVGSFLVCREVARQMRARGAGSIVNIASVSGIRGNVGRVAYGASKGGVITMTKVLAVEWAPHGIRVNAVAPGPVETPLVKQVHTEAARADWSRRVPLARYGVPDELAGIAIFLLDDERSSYVTGQTISVDGGFTAAGLIAT